MMRQNTKRYPVLVAAMVAMLTGAAVEPVAAGTIKVDFIDHLEAGLQEMDVFVPRRNDGKVYRVNPSVKDVSLNKLVYSSSEPVAHDPFDFTTDGPYAKGKPLGFTLEQWLSAEGSATIACESGTATVKASFANLVPDGVYTMWYALMPTPPTQPFTGSLDLPVGMRDGSQSVFTADASGVATYEARFDGCLDMSATNFMALLAIAWHSRRQDLWRVARPVRLGQPRADVRAAAQGVRR